MVISLHLLWERVWESKNEFKAAELMQMLSWLYQKNSRLNFELTILQFYIDVTLFNTKLIHFHSKKLKNITLWINHIVLQF